MAPPARAHAPAVPQLAATGSDPALLAAAGGAVALVLGGGVLYRRGRVMARV
ncbi:LPXTG cell wall anchor domain-containing protein [Streptomyces sp. NPDC001691]|uniref:LPXTG cell wall anchor domain-containing protein n=1 Tax=Streptomyces sp. NPDC001691 TaxID=3364600 RepID=UPI00369179AD